MLHQIQEELNFKVQSIKQLNGYDNKNYLLKADGSSYIFKTYKFSDEMHEFVYAENEILSELKNHIPNTVPQPISFKDGNFVKVLNIDDKPFICRILTYLEGSFLADVNQKEELIDSFGSFMARLDKELLKIDNLVIKSRVFEWDLQFFDLNKKYLNDILDATVRHKVFYFFQQFEENVRPYFYELRKQIIHNDANEYNVLINNEIVSSIIDFGDITHSFLINELAIAITYCTYDKDNPLKYASLFLKAYNTITPIEDLELKVLYYLIGARLCTSVCNSAHSRKIRPDNTYATVSEANALRMLDKWLAIGPIKAEIIFREAVGSNKEQIPIVKDLMNNRHKYLSSILSTSYSKPIHMKQSAFQYMYDAYGNSFLDAYNNIPHVGHSHPKVIKAGQVQMAKLNTNTRYLYDDLASYSEKLLSKFPKSLNKVFLVNSGSAASDLAIRLAKHHTGLEHVMVLEEGYHGNTQTSIDISDYKFSNPKGQGQKNYVLKTPIPNTYTGKYTEDDNNAGNLYAQDAIIQIKNSKKPIAAFIAEPIVGCAGQVVLAKDYLKHIYPIIRKQGGVCISDEVQTGFGRVGKAFWGFELHDVVPDIVVLGKPIANGHPMGAVVCTDEIAKSFETGVEFFSSFGGNPVSCQIASAVLDVIEEENLMDNAKLIGDYYIEQLNKLKSQHLCIGDVRGSGLFIGIEIVKPYTKLPDTTLAHHIKNKLREQNILISTDGMHDNVIKSKPPMCFTKANVDIVVKAISNCLK